VGARDVSGSTWREGELGTPVTVVSWADRVASRSSHRLVDLASWAVVSTIRIYQTDARGVLTRATTLLALEM
jgi:hypothetical protein